MSSFPRFPGDRLLQLRGHRRGEHGQELRPADDYAHWRQGGGTD